MQGAARLVERVPGLQSLRGLVVQAQLELAFDDIAEDRPGMSVRRSGDAGPEGGLMKTWPYSIWRIEPVLLRELALLKGYIRNPGKQEARESGNSVTLRPFSVVTVRVEARRPRSPTF
jgi:hypothetical protein